MFGSSLCPLVDHPNAKVHLQKEMQDLSQLQNLINIRSAEGGGE